MEEEADATAAEEAEEDEDEAMDSQDMFGSEPSQELVGVPILTIGNRHKHQVLTLNQLVNRCLHLNKE